MTRRARWSVLPRPPVLSHQGGWDEALMIFGFPVLLFILMRWLAGRRARGGGTVVYGDFNCPYSALASDRIDRLAAQGVHVEFRAVEHDPDVPAEGTPMTGRAGEKYTREVARVRELCSPDEAFTISVPAVLPNTRAAVEAFAKLEGAAADAYRREAFAAVWSGRGGDLPPGAEGPGGERASEWQREWEGFDERVVPTLVTEDGEVVPGEEALDRLRALLDG